MAKFFRSNRRQVLMQNKLTTYFFYALGEILLVMIGILLALQVNNWNEKRNNAFKIQSIFQEILKDLSNDIQDANRVLNYYQNKDSLLQRVLNKQVKAQDYEDTDYIYLGLILSSRTVDFNTGAYDNLISNADKIPTKYGEVVDLLKLLHIRYRVEIEGSQNLLTEFLARTLEKYMNQYDWFSLTDEEHFEQMRDYQLNDPKYLNEVSAYRIFTEENINISLRMFRYNAAIAYKTIHQILKEERPIPSFIKSIPSPKLGMLNQYIGFYQSNAEEMEDKKVDVHENFLTLNGEYNLYYLEKDRFTSMGGTILQFERSADKHIKGFNMKKNGKILGTWTKVNPKP